LSFEESAGTWVTRYRLSGATDDLCHRQLPREVTGTWRVTPAT
jgi:hypothetical protein